MSLVYPFVLNMWIVGYADEVFVNRQVILNRLTQDEADMIMATLQSKQYYTNG